MERCGRMRREELVVKGEDVLGCHCDAMRWVETLNLLVQVTSV